MILQIFMRVGFATRTAQHGEILAEHIDLAAIDRAPAGHHPVAMRAVVFHAEIGAAMGDEHVEFFKRAIIKQQFNPFARRQLALAVLCVDPLFTAAQTGSLAAVFKLLQNVHLRLPFDLHKPSGRCGQRKQFSGYLQIRNLLNHIFANLQICTAARTWTASSAGLESAA